MNTASWILSLSVLLFSGFGPRETLAHRVNLFAWVEGDTVYTVSKYPDGTRVKEGLIRVLDGAGRELLQGKTNERGEFSFPIPRRGDLTIVLEAGMGHRADWPLSREELGGDPASAPPPPPAFRLAEAAPAAVGEAVPAAALEQALEKALDRKLAPVVKMLSELHEPRLRLTDIVGGLGWILGLAGLAAWIKNRR